MVDSTGCRFFSSSQNRAFSNANFLYCIINHHTYYLLYEKKTAEFRGKESFQYEDVTFYVLGRELYVDDIKLTVTYNESKTKIIVDHIVTYKQKYGLRTKAADFIGWVEEPYLEGFVRFLEEEGVKIHR